MIQYQYAPRTIDTDTMIEMTYNKISLKTGDMIMRFTIFVSTCAEEEEKKEEKEEEEEEEEDDEEKEKEEEE